MTDKAYVNPFEDVHNKVQAFKDRARATNQRDAEVREKKADDEAVKLFDKNE